jgi:hypothetical protein
LSNLELFTIPRQSRDEWTHAASAAPHPESFAVRELRLHERQQHVLAINLLTGMFEGDTLPPFDASRDLIVSLFSYIRCQ